MCREAHGLAHVCQTGVFTWPKRKEDVYWKWFNPARVPIYFEYFIDAGEQIAEALLEYHKLGITAFLIRGFDPIQDALAYGREILPREIGRAHV